MTTVAVLTVLAIAFPNAARLTASAVAAVLAACLGFVLAVLGVSVAAKPGKPRR